MTFQENLIHHRRARGWSQEELAGRVKVSRQAVSKWETGDSAPDLSKLMALADVLELSLDTLCGRETAGEKGTSAIPTGPKKDGHTWRKRMINGLAALCLVAVGLGCGYGWAEVTREPVSPPELVEPLPDTITVDGVHFTKENESVSFRFVPSVVNEDYTYQVTFVDPWNEAKTYDVDCVGGICARTVSMEGSGYDVSLTISNGAESRAVLVASDVQFSSNSVSWSD